MDHGPGAGQTPLRLVWRCFFCGGIIDERAIPRDYTDLLGAEAPHPVHLRCAHKEARRLLALPEIAEAPARPLA